MLLRNGKKTNYNEMSKKSNTQPESEKTNEKRKKKEDKNIIKSDLSPKISKVDF